MCYERMDQERPPNIFNTTKEAGDHKVDRSDDFVNVNR